MSFIARESIQIFHEADNFHTRSRSYNLQELNVTRLIALALVQKEKEKKEEKKKIASCMCLSIFAFTYTNKQERLSNKNAATYKYKAIIKGAC